MKFLKSNLYFLSLFFLMSSCVNNLDFNQIEEVSNTPVFISSLIYFTVVEDDFLDASGLLTDLTITDVSEFKVFENEEVSKNLQAIDLSIKIKNEFNTQFIGQIQFLDENDVLKYELTSLTIDPNQLDFNYLEKIEVNTNQSLLQARKIKVMIHLPTGTSTLDANQNEAFEFKSALTYYIKTN